MKKFRMVSFTFGVLALAVMATAQMAEAAVVAFNVYYAGDAGGQTLANKSWVPGMANIGAGTTSIGSGISVTLQDQDFDTGPTKNYGVQPDNTVGVYGLGANASGTPDGGNQPFNMTIVSASPMISVSLGLGPYENYDGSSPFIAVPGVAFSYESWGGNVQGTFNADNTIFTLHGDAIYGDTHDTQGVHVFNGSVITGGDAFNGIGTWKGTTSWNASGNWDTNLPGVPGMPSPPLGTAIFSGSGTQNAELATGEKATLQALTFSNSNYTISGGSLDLQVSSGTAATVTVATGIKASILSDIIGTTLLEKDGSGTLVLSGSNSLAGTVVKAGTLGVASSSALPEDKPLTVGAGGTLIFAPASSFGGAVIAGTVTTAGAVNAVPEPSTFALLFAGLMVGFGLWRKRK